MNDYLSVLIKTLIINSSLIIIFIIKKIGWLILQIL